MARSTYFDLGRSADACPGSESGYAQRFQCGNIVKCRIWTRMGVDKLSTRGRWTSDGSSLCLSSTNLYRAIIKPAQESRD